MRRCSSCGEDNPDRARFCLACGASLLAGRLAESRKTVTVLFTDLVASTELGEQLDPESIRIVVSRYFDAMQEVLLGHGAAVEKFIGDAIMAVFGVPVAHDDDGLRALRAAAAMRARLEHLNQQLDRDFGVRLAVRTGVNTGEVIAGDPSLGQRFVSGDTVNVAARLEQAAAANEILVGEATTILAAGQAELEPVPDLDAKGKSNPLPAWRLTSVSPAASALIHRDAGPFVGRTPELEQLQHAFERVCSERRCYTATIVGPPGIGKSRLAREFIQWAGSNAQVGSGRCLPYGEGITYWPLVEVINDIAGENLAQVTQRVGGQQAALILQRISSAIGRAEASGSPAETFWAFRKFFEGVAREKPLIVVIDDIHWAETTLLDLLEYVAGFVSGAPVLLVCLARPDLLDVRPSWAVPRNNAILLPLQRISDSDVETLIERLSSTDLQPEARDRVAQAAEGNPLFIEQLLALNAVPQDAGRAITVPPNLQALLAARIDRLGSEDRMVVERAAVEGQSFHRGSVEALLDDAARSTVGACLISLSRHGFIQADEALFPGDDAFRFSHLLVRDAAYEAIPKQLRSQLHERFATWLEHVAGERLDQFEEVVAYHLEQAHNYAASLGSASVQRLADAAGARLVAAGSRASLRGDLPAAANLLTRAVKLLPPLDARRLEALPELGLALIETGALGTAKSVLREADELARDAGNEVIRWRAAAALIALQTWTGGVAGADKMEQLQTIAEVVERLGDDLGLARIWHLIGLHNLWSGRMADGVDAFQRALVHAGRAQSRREEAAARQWLLVADWFGPTSAAEGIAHCHETLQRAGDVSVEAQAMIELGCFLALQGTLDEAKASYAAGYDKLADLGQELTLAGVSQEYFDIEMLADNPHAAEIRLRDACARLEQMGEKGYLATRRGCLAETLYAQGRYDEAAELSEQMEVAAIEDPTDLDPQIRWRAVRARVLARRGEHARAEALAREALGLIAGFDWTNQHAQTAEALAEVLELGGRRREAQAALREALRLYEAKGNVVAARKVRARMDAALTPSESGSTPEDGNG
jgi:class 3 adenylate cyclase/tetratricopeptide (TPR) repeat protein